MLLALGYSPSNAVEKDPEAAAPRQVTFDLARPGNVFAAIYGKEGRMVRELARDEPKTYGRHTLAWDGLDMDGKPVPAGKYEWRSLQTQGLRSEYLMSVGTSVGERWWPGNHAGPTALVVAEDSLIAAANSEGPPYLTRVGFDRKVMLERRQFEPARNPRDLAVGGGKAFYLDDSDKVFADENGDGLIDANELRLGEAHRDATSPTLGNGGFCLRIDDALNAWIGGGSSDKVGMYLIYKPERITACGAPVWPLQGVAAGPKTERRGETRSILPVTDGGAFALLGGNGDGTKSSSTYDTAVHGWGWPSTMTDGMALLRLNAAGNRIWRSSSKVARWPHPRGQLHGAWHLGRELKGCVPVFDWLEQSCEFWTTDGLYVGGLFDGRDPYDGRDLSKPGSQPDRLYTWLGINGKRIGKNNYDQQSPIASDDSRTGGEAAELPDGSVVFLGQGANNNPCYRITGWDGWVRQRGDITISQPAPSPAQNGTGLTAEVFANLDLSGEPATTRIDECLWFGIHKPWPKDTLANDFSIRWTGFIEPRFTEDYCLSIYARGEFKLWVDGKEVTWAQQDYPREREIRKSHSLPYRWNPARRSPSASNTAPNPWTPNPPNPARRFT